MPRFKVAHMRHKTDDLIVVQMDKGFGLKTSAERGQIVAELETRAGAAGLAGEVVPVWVGGDRLNFVAPERWHRYFAGMSWDQVTNNVNRDLHW
jgi:hypothetical protein